jgi:Rhodopirellula transposase DDE domain
LANNRFLRQREPKIRLIRPSSQIPSQKGKPLKTTDATDAIFANVKRVRDEMRNDPETLEISMDTKAKVGFGDYARGGKNPDRQPR